MQNSRFSTRILVRIGILVAMSAVLKVFLSFTLSTYRFTFYDLPLMIIGIMFGPIAGAIGGFTVDWINIMAPNLATGFNWFTVSSMMWGIIPGIFLFGKEKLSWQKLLMVALLTSVVTFSINTYQLYIWMGAGVISGLPARMITLLIKLPIQVIVLDVLYNRVLVYDLKLLKQR